MRPRFFPMLVNGRLGDAALYVGFLMERRAMLFDLGDIRTLAPRKLLRLTDIFVSHAHVDHFIGFDHLLRIILGRGMTLRLWGPEGFIDRVAAKLGGYVWNLAPRFPDDLVLDVTEMAGPDDARRARFRLSNHFAREDLGAAAVAGGVLLDEPSLRVRAAVLDHGIPCLAFALEETAHINVWPDRLAALGLATGPWLAELKAAARAGRPDDTPIPVRWRDPEAGRPPTLPLGELRREVVATLPGQKIAYVTDTAPTAANARAVVELARGADVLFIEGAFAAADTAMAAERHHLTTADAGRLARRAGAGRVEPFHFSARYGDDAVPMIREVEAAFRGDDSAA